MPGSARLDAVFRNGRKDLNGISQTVVFCFIPNAHLSIPETDMVHGLVPAGVAMPLVRELRSDIVPLQAKKTITHLPMQSLAIALLAEVVTARELLFNAGDLDQDFANYPPEWLRT